MFPPLLWILLSAAVAHTAYWFAVWVQMIRTTIGVPTARAALLRPRTDTGERASTTRHGTRMCVIIPAHNEAECIAHAVRTVLDQQWGGAPAPLSLVVCLDRCTDSTRSVLESALSTEDRARTEILEITHCPDDWAGKSHAIWRAVHDAPSARAADVLVFVDADTHMDPRCLEAAATLLRERRLTMLSLLSTLTRDRLFERVAQPAAGFELVRQFPISRANGSGETPASRPFANGQFIMIRREDYLKIGGHEARRGEVLEDVELARECQRHGCSSGIFLADGLLTCRMYTSFAEFKHGWTRIFRESCNHRPARMRAFAWRLRLMSVFLPLASAAAAIVGAWWLNQADPNAPDELSRLAARLCMWIGTGGFIGWLALLVTAYRIGKIGPVWALAYPIGAWQVSNILLRAALEQERQVPITWGGRSYHRPTRV